MGDDKLTIIFTAFCIAIGVAWCAIIVLLRCLIVSKKRSKRERERKRSERAPQRAENAENESYSNFLSQLQSRSTEPLSASVRIPAQPTERRKEERKVDNSPKAQSAPHYEKLERILTSGTDNRVARQYELTAEKAERAASRLKAIAVMMFCVAIGSSVSLAHSSYFLTKFRYFRYDTACSYCENIAEDIIEVGNRYAAMQTQAIVWCAISTIIMIILRIIAKSKQEQANDARLFATLERKKEGG